MRGRVGPSWAPLYLGAIIVAARMDACGLYATEFFLDIKVHGIPAKISVLETFVFAMVVPFVLKHAVCTPIGLQHYTLRCARGLPSV